MARTKCEADEWMCSTTRLCIPSVMRCDGTVQCADLSDELECEAGACGDQEMWCGGQCLDLSHSCDGVSDCKDGSDELNCKTRGQARKIVISSYFYRKFVNFNYFIYQVQVVVEWEVFQQYQIG